MKGWDIKSWVDMGTCVNWAYCGGTVTAGLKILPVFRNRGGRIKEVADSWEPMGKSIGLYKTGRISELSAEERWSATEFSLYMLCRTFDGM